MMKTTVIIKGETLGDGSEELGIILTGSFLRKLWGSPSKPETIVFYNSGVKLLAKGTPVWDALDWPIKTREHRPTEKVQDVLVSIMAGNKNMSQINTQLRPDLILAAAWNRERFAEQSTIAKMFDGLSRDQIAQLRAGHHALFRCHSQTSHHTFGQAWLVLDIDPEFSKHI